MADITLNVPIVISDVNKDMAIPAFLLAHPMPQILDPDWVDPEDGTEQPLVDEYESPKAWAEAHIAEVGCKYILRQINRGVDIGNQATTQAHLTEL